MILGRQSTAAAPAARTTTDGAYDPGAPGVQARGRRARVRRIAREARVRWPHRCVALRLSPCSFSCWPRPLRRSRAHLATSDWGRRSKDGSRPRCSPTSTSATATPERSPRSTRARCRPRSGDQSLQVGRVVPFSDAGEGVAFIFCVDISKSMSAADFAVVRSALGRWIDEMRPLDRAAVLSFGSESRLVLDFTADKAALRAALEPLGPTDMQTVLHRGLARRVRAVVAAGSRASRTPRRGGALRRQGRG